ncbi:MAG: sugar phosphate nucleotidyltransferase, partial [Oscillospiraceae bacterium]
MRENKAMGIILPGSVNTAMGVLIDERTVGSIPFGGRYRLIDFILSSMAHAGIWDVGVLTRNKYESLMDHLGSGRDWDLARKGG